MPGSLTSSRSALSGTEADPLSVARRVALDALSRRSQSTDELRMAFAKRAIPPEIGEDLLVSLTRSGLLNDADFARSWRDSRIRTRGLAPQAIGRELRGKGIDDEVIAEVIGEISQEDQETSLELLLAKKMRSLKRGDRVKQERSLVGFLLRKGYRSDRAIAATRACLNSLYEEAGN